MYNIRKGGPQLDKYIRYKLRNSISYLIRLLIMEFLILLHPAHFSSETLFERKAALTRKN